MISAAPTSTASNHRCRAVTVNGRPCRAAAGASGYCFLHDPALASERAQARRAGGRASKTPHSDAQAPSEVHDIAGALKLLDYTLGELLVFDNSLLRVRALIALAGAYSSLLSAGELEERVKVIEAALAAREKP
jgi:hypothetical protein